MNSSKVHGTAAVCEKTPFQKPKILLVEPNISQFVHKVRIRVNPLDGKIMDCMAADRPVFGKAEPKTVRQAAMEAEKRRDKESKAAKEWEIFKSSLTVETLEKYVDDQIERQAEYRRRAAGRARRNVHDLAACNEWDYFITLTLNKEKIDRYDYKAAVKKVGQWLNDRVKRNGLKYVGVPEYHKDKAIHFHFLTKGDRYTLKDSKRTQKGRKVYNLLDWPTGWSTAVVLDNNREAVAWYMAKYITKQTQKGIKEAIRGTIGGRYYFHGGELNTPLVYYYGAVLNNFEDVVQSGKTDGVKAQYIEGADLELYYIDTEKIGLSIYDVGTGEAKDLYTVPEMGQCKGQE